VREEESGAADEVIFSLDASMSSGDSIGRGASCEGWPKGVVRVGVSGICGSWGGLLIGLPLAPGPLEGAPAGAVGDISERRWSRRQYEKTVDGGMVL
jgi:hypothetical protein